MIDSGIVFVICFVAIFVSNFISYAISFRSIENPPLMISVISAFGSGAVVLILWLIEHVRFV